MNNNTSYETQAIDLSLLSVLDITKEGKVVSVEKWVELWTLVFQHINKIDAFCVDMQATLDNYWHESEVALNEIIEDMQMKYASLSTGFTHYGEAPPQNPHIKFWVRRMEDIATYCFITNEDIDKTYTPTSPNAQSGTAVAGAISNLVSLEDNTEWIFDGGDASGSVEIDLVIDAEMSDTSNNPVSNKVIKKYVDNMVDLIYPVGSIYMSANDTSPSILFGGEWERIKDRFLLAAGNKYSVRSAGGEAEHKLTVDEMPSHNHGEKPLVGYMWNIASQSDTHNLAATKDGIVSTAMVEGHGYAMRSTTEAVVDGFKIDATHTHNSVGGGKSHNNMPPYLAVYMWQRIS